MGNVRQQKIASQIQRIVATFIQRELADPRADGLISVTKVEVTPDLAIARVYVSIFGNKTPTATVYKGLESAIRRITGAVAKGLPIRTAPKLELRLDESLKREAEMLRKIDEAMKTSPGGGTAEEKPGEDTDDEEAE